MINSPMITPQMNALWSETNDGDCKSLAQRTIMTELEGVKLY